jgi:transposase-like protein
VKTSRRQHTAALKAKVALEAVKERLSAAQIAATYHVHPTQVGVWKKQLLAGVAEVFDARPERAAAEQEALTAELYQQIGKLEMELQWLQKKTVAPALRRAAR